MRQHERVRPSDDVAVVVVAFVVVVVVDAVDHLHPHQTAVIAAAVVWVVPQEMTRTK